MIWALHGAVGMAADWRYFADTMPAHHRGVRRLDLWRFLDCCPMSLDQCGRALAEEIKRVDPEPTLLGYSMGGRLALHAMLNQPGLWKSAIIVSAHPGLTQEAERVARREKDAEWSALALKGDWSDFLSKWNDQDILGGSGEMPDRLQLKDRRVSVARSFVDWSLGTQADLTAEFAKITCPTLWLTGERDVKFGALGEQVAPLLASGRHQVIADCGHRIPWEQPKAFQQACLEFLGNALET
ncbi:MAG: alpha/beta fold hydrolase [Akkermansiaceae bacterium]|nr:alpha/beta fold hydrolase [Akkermansiaceae bacterium]